MRGSAWSYEQLNASYKYQDGGKTVVLKYNWELPTVVDGDLNCSLGLGLDPVFVEFGKNGMSNGSHHGGCGSVAYPHRQECRRQHEPAHQPGRIQLLWHY